MSHIEKIRGRGVVFTILIREWRNGNRRQAEGLFVGSQLSAAVHTGTVPVRAHFAADTIGVAGVKISNRSKSIQSVQGCWRIVIVICQIIIVTMLVKTVVAPAVGISIGNKAVIKVTTENFGDVGISRVIHHAGDGVRT